jgi:hypothetical protein
MILNEDGGGDFVFQMGTGEVEAGGVAEAVFVVESGGRRCEKMTE